MNKHLKKLTLSKMRLKDSINPQLNSIQSFAKNSILNNFHSLKIKEMTSAQAFHKTSISDYMDKLGMGAMASSQALHEASISDYTDRLGLGALSETSMLDSINRLGIGALAETSMFDSINRLGIGALAETSMFDSINRLKTEVLTKTNMLNNFSYLETNALKSVKELYETNQSWQEITENMIIELDLQDNTEINEEKDFNKLPEKIKPFLIYIYHYYFLPLLLAFLLSNYITNNADKTKKELELISTLSEIKNLVQKSNSKFDRLALKGFRVTTAKSLNFREDASIKSKIFFNLPIGTLVEVIDNSNRSWLLVEVEKDGEFKQGWVFRRYTTYFK